MISDMELVEKPTAILEGDHHTDSDQSDSESEQTETIFDIARILASNTLKERNVGYKKMENLLFGESAEFNLDNEAALKVWKGLFFMLWHSDGYARQEKLGNVLEFWAVDVHTRTVTDLSMRPADFRTS